MDLLHRIVHLEPGETKNGDARHFVMIPDLYSSIATQKAIRDEKYPACPWVFFRYASGNQIRDFRGPGLLPVWLRNWRTRTASRHASSMICVEQECGTSFALVYLKALP